MRADLAARLRCVMRGEIATQTGVAGVAGVASARRYASKPLELRQLRPLRVESAKFGNAALGSLIEGVSAPPEQADVEIEERAGLASDSMPPLYRDAWARLNHRRPPHVSEPEWRQVINCTGRFFDKWSNLALGFGWAVGELFDIPCGEGPGGLIWFLRGEGVRALGPENAITESGRVFDRLERI